MVMRLILSAYLCTFMILLVSIKNEGLYCFLESNTNYLSPTLPRYGVNDPYVGRSFGRLANIVSITAEEINIGVMSSLIILLPAMGMIQLFRKAGPMSKGSNRIDRSIQKAAAEGKIILPKKSYQRIPSPQE